MRIDLNCDAGEHVGPELDAELLPQVTSANVACGVHAGDAHTMRRVCAAAAADGIRIGAHVSYADREGFGRRELDLAPELVADDIVYQVGALSACARAEGTAVTYVKPHGALYTRCHRDRAMADAVAGAVASVDSNLRLLAAVGSELAPAGESHGLIVFAEAFADRRYTAAGTLVPRTRPDALLGVREAAAQAVEIAVGHRVATDDGSWIEQEAHSICLHGDTPGAAGIARAVHEALRGAGVSIEPFT